MLQSLDQWYGFWGSMGDAAETAWALALPAIVAATGCEEDEVRDFLDSRYGRHFADTVRCHQERGHALAQAIGAAITEWRGYHVGKGARRAYGMPEGADYLTDTVLAGPVKFFLENSPAGGDTSCRAVRPSVVVGRHQSSAGSPPAAASVLPFSSSSRSRPCIRRSSSSLGRLAMASDSRYSCAWASMVN